MIAAVVHFDESTIEKGCIRVVPGSWKRGRMEHIGEGGHHLEVEEFPVEQATPCEAEPGGEDAVLCSGIGSRGEVEPSPRVMAELLAPRSLEEPAPPE